MFAAALDGQAQPDLYWMAEDGARVVRITSTAGAELYPTWSPDHEHIAFVRDFQLFVIDPDGTNERLVAAHTGRQRTINGDVYSTIVGPAAWSPDGTQLAYPYPRNPDIVTNGSEVVDESYATMIHLVGADGTNDHAMATDPNRTINSIAWVSDGTTLSFSVADDCPDCAGGQWEAASNVDGSGYRELRFFPQPEGTVGWGPTKQLDWTPDATKWTYVRGGGTVFPYDAPGPLFTSSANTDADQRQLVTDAGWNPRWSPDAAKIAFIANDGIHVVDADGRNEHRALAAAGIRGLDW